MVGKKNQITGGKENGMSRLSAGELQILKDLLRRREVDARAEIRKEVDRRREGPSAGNVGAGAVDEAATDPAADMDQALIAQRLNELHDIEAARKRMLEATYGICIHCGRDIGYQRLSKYPTAKRCAACQRTRERLHSKTGYATL